MPEPYGLPPGTSINYKALGFPAWVDQLCLQWGLDSSTYAGHQEGDRADIGAAPNPTGLNRGIDWAGDPQKMLDFAHWLVSIGPERTPGQYGPPGLEMVIFQHPQTGEQVWYPHWVDFSGDLPNHTDHVHTRFSASIIDVAPAPPSKADQYALAIIGEGQRRGITARGIQIALTTALVESNLTMYANSNDPASLNLPHDAVGSDHMSVGLFQQQDFPPWPSLECRMDAACSAGGFYDQLVKLDYNGGDSPGSYAQAVQGSAFPDRYDERWDEAVALYNRLIAATPPIPSQPTPQPGGVWMPDASIEQLIREIHRALLEKRPSLSRYADSNDTWSVVELIRNDDGFWYDLIVEHDAALGDGVSKADIERAAARGDKIGANFLASLSAAAQQHTSTPTPTPQPQPTPIPQPIPTPPQPQPTPVSGEISLASAVDNFAQQMSVVRAALHKLIG